MAKSDPFKTGVHFQSKEDWRSESSDIEEDELLDETPKDVVSILGFDPLEFEEGGDEEA